MTTMKILIVVNIFDRYNNKKIKWAGIFQIMTLRLMKPFSVNLVKHLVLTEVQIPNTKYVLQLTGLVLTAFL